MKKFMIIVCSIISLFVLSGCGSNNSIKTPDGSNNTPSVTTQGLTIKDYYSYQENVKYVYEGKGNEYASYTLSVDYISATRVQLRMNNGGTETVKILNQENGELVVLLSRPESYYRENLTQSPSSSPEILLKEPLTKGTTWTLSDGRTRSITNLDVDVTTSSGNYKTLEVTTESNDSKTVDYYAPKVGLVKSVFTSNGTEVSSTLIKIESNVPLVQTIKIFYPNVQENKVYYVNKQISFKTNEVTRTILESSLKELPKGDFEKVLGPNVKINSLYLNKDNMVYIDFSKELLTEMNAGSGYEELILKCITNTFGSYYGVDKVYITVEGNPYSSGHFSLTKDEHFTVNVKNVTEFK